MVSFDEILNIAVPTLLILIVLGFLWVKFLDPYVVPMLGRMWDWVKNTNEQRQTTSNTKEIIYE